MLVWADEHDRALGRRDVPGEPVAVVEVGRDAELQHVHELVDGRGHP